jgi:hypothetical protein
MTEEGKHAILWRRHTAVRTPINRQHQHREAGLRGFYSAADSEGGVGDGVHRQTTSDYFGLKTVTCAACSCVIASLLYG